MQARDTRCGSVHPNQTCARAAHGAQGVDVRHAGIATHYIPSQHLPEVRWAGLLHRIVKRNARDVRAAPRRSAARCCARCAGVSARAQGAAAPAPLQALQVLQAIEDLGPAARDAGKMQGGRRRAWLRGAAARASASTGQGQAPGPAFMLAPGIHLSSAVTGAVPCHAAPGSLQAGWGSCWPPSSVGRRCQRARSSPCGEAHMP